MAASKDSRRHPRYEVDAYVDYTGKEIGLRNKVQNISLGGICIQSKNLEDVGTVVDLVINFPELDTSIAMKGEVVWANRDEPRDMGIRYLDMDDDKLATLRKYIREVRKRQGGRARVSETQEIRPTSR